MSGEKISQALGDIGDAYLESAMDVYERKGSNRKRWYRIAAVAAVIAILLTALLWPADTGTDENGIISAPGVLKVYACELEDADIEAYELNSDKPFLRAICTPYASSSSASLPLTFQIPNDYFGTAEITFEISSDCTDFCEKMVLKNGESVYFSDVPHRAIRQEVGVEGSFYLDIIIRADDKVVGYGIVSFCFYSIGIYAYEFKTICFPLMEGVFQDVSEEYVWQQIEEYKQSKAYGEGYALVRQLFKDAKK